MRTAIKSILIGIVILVSAGKAFAYPPDNAAVLYYKSFMLMKEPNDAVRNMLNQLSRGDIKLNAQIRLYLEDNQKAIKEIVTATQIKNCDWGLNYSDGMAMLMPHLDKGRYAAKLLAADGKILAEKGDYKTALERCLTIHNLGIHIGNDTLISCLVSRAISRIANGNIVDMLPQISNDTETLQRLKGQLADVSSGYPSMRVAIGNDAKLLMANPTNRKELLEVIHDPCLSKEDQDKTEKIIRQHDDDEFYVRVAEYYQSVISKIQIAYDLPYTQAKQAQEDLYKEVENAAKEKPEAVITKVFLPAINRVLTIDTRGKTHLNAVIAGIEIYLIRAKTGKLPDGLPAGLPKDVFSGKDFIYEKTDAGFTLTGQGKDLDKDIVQKYEFKVIK